MKKRTLPVVVLLFVLLMMLSCKKQSEVTTPMRDSTYYYMSQVGMWYTVWWASEDSSPRYYIHHWINETRVKPVKFGYYATADESKLEYDLRLFKQWGIDYLILDDTNSHLADSGNIATNINKIFKKAKSLGENAPKLCFAGGQPLLQKDEEGMKREMDIFYNYTVKYPEQTFYWENRPLFVNFTIPTYYSWEDEEKRFTMRPAAGHTSEGWETREENNLTVIGMYGWVFDKQYESSEVYGINPGFSRSHNNLSSTVEPISRENGELYVNAWLQAIKANPKMIVIASWNDHAEETGIEAVNIVDGIIEGREEEHLNPYFYEQITQGYLALKTGYLEGFYYRAESDSTIYQYESGELKKVSSVPKMTAVIVVPDDYFDWSGVSIKR